MRPRGGCEFPKIIEQGEIPLFRRLEIEFVMRALELEALLIAILSIRKSEVRDERWEVRGRAGVGTLVPENAGCVSR